MELTRGSGWRHAQECRRSRRRSTRSRGTWSNFRTLQRIRKLQSSSNGARASSSEWCSRSSSCSRTRREVFKLIDPVLVKQELVEVKNNVSKRIEFIKNDISRLDDNIKAKEKQQDEVGAIGALQKQAGVSGAMISSLSLGRTASPPLERAGAQPARASPRPRWRRSSRQARRGRRPRRRRRASAAGPRKRPSARSPAGSPAAQQRGRRGDEQRHEPTEKSTSAAVQKCRRPAPRSARASTCAGASR